MLGALGFVARHGRWALVLGLLCGLLVPSLAAALKPWLAELVLVLLFLTGLRVGPQQALSGLKGIGRTLAVVLGYQLALPLLALAAFAALGLAGTPYAVAFTLMLAAPSVTGSPNIAILLGHAPEPAFRLLILGTALLPLTVVPVFWLSPALGDLAAALWAAAKLLLSIWLAIGLAFGVRHLVQPELKAAQSHALDGVMSIALAVIVVGLMSAVGPALQSQPWEVLRFTCQRSAASRACFSARGCALCDCCGQPQCGSVFRGASGGSFAGIPHCSGLLPDPHVSYSHCHAPTVFAPALSGQRRYQQSVYRDGG